MPASVINATVNGLNATGGNTAGLELQVSGTTAVTINSTGDWVLTNPLPIASGGTGSNTGTFSGANVTSINASNISTGTLDNARTTASSSNGANTIVARDASGDFSADIITANGFTGSGANLTSLNASSISTGTLGVANGGTGATTLTANAVILGNTTSAVQFVAPGTASNVLTSNGTTWVSQAPSGSVPGTGDVGSYAFLGSTTLTPTAAGSTKAGSNLRYSGFIASTAWSGTSPGGGSSFAIGNGGTPAGTWKAMGRDASGVAFACSTTWYGATLWVRTV